ncbi:MAG: hypothetical protein WC966_06505 [Bradymonadales bacterium]|jgi:hypothetical protein
MSVEKENERAKTDANPTENQENDAKSAKREHERVSEKKSENASKKEKSHAQTSSEEERVLRAVESLIQTNEQIIAVCDDCRQKVMSKNAELSEKLAFKKIARRIVRHYADKSALSGGISGLPAFLPGIGSLVAFVGASAVDVVLTLKFEVEMTLCLCHLAGFDIYNERDRQLAFTLASVSSYDVRSSDSAVLDTLALARAAFWDYSMRQLSKYLLSMIGKIIVLSAAKSAFRAVPVLGVLVGISVNKVLSTRTGNYCISALWQRRPKTPNNKNSDVVDAKIVESANGEEKPNG